MIVACNRPRSLSFKCSEIFYLLIIFPDHFKDVYIDATDNIKMDLKEIGWKGVDWIELVHSSDGGDELSSSVKCVEFLEWLTSY